jgi:flagellar biosynthesis component FlhA
MTEIEQKVQLVRKYIHQKKGVDIVDINLKDGVDLQKLDYAYKIAFNYFYK